MHHPVNTLIIFSIIDWSVPFQSTPDRANVGVLRFLHFLVMVSFFYFHIPRSRTGEYPISVHFFIYYSLRYVTSGTSFGHPTVALDRLVITPSLSLMSRKQTRVLTFFSISPDRTHCLRHHRGSTMVIQARPGQRLGIERPTRFGWKV